jgi:ABC-type transport system substrate-binding protein
VRRYLSVLALVAVLGLVAAACGGDDGGGTGATGATSATGASGELQPGGTVELAMLGDVSAAFDPQKEYYSVTWEWYRCCLLRTLLSYNGKTTAEGGADLQPDIASALPEISSDGLTYTFTLKSGVNYGDPFGDVSVTSGDIVRALEREATRTRRWVATTSTTTSSTASPTSAPARPTRSRASRRRTTAPSWSTLTEPAGYLPYLFAMAATAPIPPNGDTPLGAAEGHTKDYGRFLVATGSRTSSRAPRTSTSRFRPTSRRRSRATSRPFGPARAQPELRPVHGRLRPGLPGRLQHHDRWRQQRPVQQGVGGELDGVVDGIVPPPILRQYSTDPTLQPLLHINPSDAVRYVSFNLAQPPFDDIHVRKAGTSPWTRPACGRCVVASPSVRSRVTSW